MKRMPLSVRPSLPVTLGLLAVLLVIASACTPAATPTPTLAVIPTRPPAATPPPTAAPLPASSPTPEAAKAPVSACISCHQNVTPGIVADWSKSAMGEKGLDCLICHTAEGKNRPDVHDHNGSRIITVVTPKDCGVCHAEEAKQFQESHHAQAAQFIGSLDNMLGEVIGGAPVADVGCRQCHGSQVKLTADKQLDPATWPNTGIGRVNLDGSTGACSACHARHRFSVAQARQPEDCAKCHLGPDHPQKEVYDESKHGILFYATRPYQNLQLAGGKWIVGKDNLYPTCASCHMSATPKQAVTHDVGARISWTLRPAVSKKQDDWQKKRGAMQEVCGQCHAASYVGNFYKQFDAAVALYDTKFGKPATDVMARLRADKKLTDTNFDEELEWVYYELWHHEGRRARHGAAMMGPDYAWWHGLYEVANVFYNEFLPMAERLSPGVTKPVLDMPEHQWTKGLSREEIQRQLEFYKERYGQQ